MKKISLVLCVLFATAVLMTPPLVYADESTEAVQETLDTNKETVNAASSESSDAGATENSKCTQCKKCNCTCSHSSGNDDETAGTDEEKSDCSCSCSQPKTEEGNNESE